MTKRLLLIDTTFDDTALESFKNYIDPSNFFLLVDLSDVEFCMLQLSGIPAETYDSVGIVAQGHNSAIWGQSLLDDGFAQLLKSRCKTSVDVSSTLEIDIFAWSMLYSDLVLQVFSSNLGLGVRVNFTSTARAYNWELENTIQQGKRVLAPSVRNLQNLYLGAQDVLARSSAFKF